MKIDNFVFTIFTPTFNRSQLLKRAFWSIKEQNFHNLEYIVIDSGSDETRELVEQWQGDVDFPIRYIWQPKSGKHAAINKAVQIARGQFFIILDDDDYLAPHALDRLLFHWNRIPLDNRLNYCGVVGLFAYPDGVIVGTPFPRSILDSNSIEIRTKYKVKGDKFGMNLTNILRKYPFPENLGNFVTESLVWNRIARKYSERYVNEVLAYKEYQKGGLSDRSIELRAGSSEAARTYYKEFLEINERYVSFFDRLQACINYVRFSIHGNVPARKQYFSINKKIYWIVSYPIGYVVYLNDKRILAKIRMR